MQKVEHLCLPSCNELPNLLCENLRLLPNVKKLSCYSCYFGTSGMKGNDCSTKQDLLKVLSTVLPSLEDLEITAGALYNSMTAREEGQKQRGEASYSFKKLTKLKVRPEEGKSSLVATGLCVGIDEVFPSLSHIELSFHPTDRLHSPFHIFPLNTVKTVTIPGFLEYPPDFFDIMFPKLESLIMVGRGLKQLTYTRVCFFHPHLRHLDISGNDSLKKILGAMESSQPRPNEAPPGGLHLPKLESLNVYGTFYTKIPQCFLQGCPGIKVLRMSLDPCLYECDRDGWWKFLAPLSELKELYVEITPPEGNGYKLKDKSTFAGNKLQDVVERLSTDLIEARKSLNLHTSIYFGKNHYNPCKMEVIKTIEAPESAKVPGEERMDVE